jgi:hypothetical protein
MHVTQQAQQLMQKADAEIAALKQQLQQQQARLDDKSGDLAIKAHGVAIDDYDAETKRLSALGGIDPMSLQIVVRQLLRDMLQTDIVPMLHAHAATEGVLQAAATPPPPVPINGGGNGAGAPAGP